MEGILNSVMVRLQAEVPELRYIGEDLGQLDQLSPAVQFPCALISINSGRFEPQKENNKRKAKIGLLVRVADDPATIASMAAPDQHKVRAFSIFNILDKVGDALHRYKCDGCVPLEELEFNRFGREDNIREYGIQFTGNYMRTSE